MEVRVYSSKSNEGSVKRTAGSSIQKLTAYLFLSYLVSGSKTRVSKDLVTKKSLKTLEKPSTAKVEKEEPKDGLDKYLANNQQTATSDLDGISPSISAL